MENHAVLSDTVIIDNNLSGQIIKYQKLFSSLVQSYTSGTKSDSPFHSFIYLFPDCPASCYIIHDIF